MEHVRRLVRIWSWLPAFRVVGESAHLPTASEELGVTAPALSRSIKLLEDAIGQPLFRRIGRRLELNDAGELFLSALRASMREIDEGLERIGEGEPAGSVRIAARPHHAWVYCRPAIARLRRRHPALVPHLASAGAAEVADGLCAGRLDVAVLANPIRRRELEVEHLATMTYGVYAGEGHSLYRSRRPALARILEHPFVAPAEGVDDGWPPHLERRIGARVSGFHDAVALVASGDLLGLLPDAVASDRSAPARLRRLPLELAPPAPVYASYRRPIGRHRRTEAVLEALRAGAESGRVAQSSG